MRQNFRHHTGYNTEQTLAYTEMNKSFITFIEKCHELMFFISKNGNFIHVSSAAEQLSGFTAVEYRSFNIIDIIHPDDIEEAREKIRIVSTSQNAGINFKLRSLNKQGAYCWIEGKITNMLDDNLDALVIRFDDISNRVLNEQEQTLQRLELSKRNQDLSQFVYIISHNLRTPLSNLIGLINILETDHLDDYNKGIIDLFKCSTDRLTETVFDLTHILTLKDNQGVKMTKVNVQKVFEKVCLSFNDQIKQLGVKLICNFSYTQIIFNKSYLESILTNLMSNAIKYRRHSRQLEIQLALTKDQINNCVLTFSDNGSGIDMSTNKDKLFGLHQRFHSHINGNGVGLYITRSKIVSLGGSIEVNSKIDEGTTFTITFKGEPANLLSQSPQPALQ